MTKKLDDSRLLPRRLASEWRRQFKNWRFRVCGQHIYAMHKVDLHVDGKVFPGELKVVVHLHTSASLVEMFAGATSHPSKPDVSFHIGSPYGRNLLPTKLLADPTCFDEIVQFFASVQVCKAELSSYTRKR